MTTYANAPIMRGMETTPARLPRTVRISRPDGSFYKDVTARTLKGGVDRAVNDPNVIGVKFKVAELEQQPGAFLITRGTAEFVYFARFLGED